MYLKHQGGSATNYSLEALYLIFQVYALLSPQVAHCLIWNRGVKIRISGVNIPLDLRLEFFNKTIKEAIKKAGSKCYSEVTGQDQSFPGSYYRPNESF